MKPFQPVERVLRSERQAMACLLGLTLVLCAEPISANTLETNARQRPAPQGDTGGILRLEDFGAVPVRGADRHDETHAGSNVTAFGRALAALPHGGRIQVGPGTFFLNAGIVLKSSIWLQGSGGSNSGMATRYGIGGTVFRPTKGATIPKLFYSQITSQRVRLSDFSVIGGARTKTGVVYDAEVGAAVHLVGLSHEVDGLGVYNISGDGIWMGDKTIKSPPYYWIFWLRNSSVHFCGGYGIRVETTDGFISNNYAGNNGRGSVSFGGGNIWTANHFDNSHDPAFASLTVELQGGRGGRHTAEQILGNYFDVGEVGLRIRGSARNPVNFMSMIGNNFFRANRVLDIHVVGVRNPVIDGFLSNKGGMPCVQTRHSVRFEHCPGNRIVRNGRWDASWPVSLQVVDPDGEPVTHFLNCVQDGTVLPPVPSPVLKGAED